MTDIVKRDEIKLDLSLLKRTICKGATDNEFNLFVKVCERTQLDPFARQIFAVKRWDSSVGDNVMTAQISIDGARLTAQRSGEYEGQTKPEWCDEDGNWHDVWLTDDIPVAARVGIWRKGFREPVIGIAHYKEYVQLKKDGTPTKVWKEKFLIMTAKCAEMLGLRKAFPMEMSGLYAPEEFGVAEEDAYNAEVQAKRVIQQQIHDLFKDPEQRAGLFEDWKRETGYEGEAKDTTIGEYNQFYEYCQKIHREKDIQEGEFEEVTSDLTPEEQEKLDRDNPPADIEQGKLNLGG